MSEAYGPSASLYGLPDPEADPQFYAGVPGRRLVAWFVDVALVLAVGVPLALLFGLVTLGFGFPLFPVIIAGVGFLYRWVTLSSRSSTWGMRLMGIEFRRHDGARLDAGTAFLHTVLYMVSISFVVIQAISCVTILTTAYGQSIADMILKVAAINRPAN